MPSHDRSTPILASLQQDTSCTHHHEPDYACWWLGCTCSRQPAWPSSAWTAGCMRKDVTPPGRPVGGRDRVPDLEQRHGLSSPGPSAMTTRSRAIKPRSCSQLWVLRRMLHCGMSVTGHNQLL